MRRLLINDILTAIPGTRTFWHDLMQWFDMEFVGGDYATLAEKANDAIHVFNPGLGIESASLIIRNATWFGPINPNQKVPTISLLQDVITEGPARAMQEAVISSSHTVVFNSAFTTLQYKARFKKFTPPVPTQVGDVVMAMQDRIIPLPVDFSLFEPGNAMGLQQALSLPDGSVCWIGACQGAAGQIKGWDIFLAIVRQNPDINFVAVFKDALPEYCPPNMRMFVKLPHEELVKVIGACRVGLCTSRIESQHLAGIEMGACGLPMVVPPVGTYYARENDFPGFVMKEGTEPEHYATALRLSMSQEINRDAVRCYWRREFDKPVVKAQWEKLVEEVENGQS